MLSPVVIRSLFRSGSTWLFGVFRRAEAGYWCYQEPFNEGLCGLSPNTDAAGRAHGRQFSAVPQLWGLFDPSICPALDDYASRLIRHAQGRRGDAGMRFKPGRGASEGCKAPAGRALGVDAVFLRFSGNTGGALIGLSRSRGGHGPPPRDLDGHQPQSRRFVKCATLGRSSYPSDG